ncbi:hypothetical protein [Streptomyces acidiscabies]|uniref:hypothetical protein n=1 Tax=Streptomyces acidiscabies TaxID=42234 RepID=UPI0038F75BA2
MDAARPHSSACCFLGPGGVARFPERNFFEEFRRIPVGLPGAFPLDEVAAAVEDVGGGETGQGGVRLVTSFATTEAEVDALLKAAARHAA